ncbi:kinase-like domain-containing protein [Rhizophagus irregularis DAOM 181602=DAOM 197198]|uniref:Cdc15p n=3 Tax=Rhizophagus irregularis TaxID=588596 RepID=A0A015J450_RHIIW|nr:kinase-like domain-containing protein [Rhizophagus irregularis DAOM 181602=DAOM 197198]EXX64262.1 Cdc15p [Rhizophagus irregularis DAOM 197198w]POG71486.1 kinase-like domain-containing protein [Rhizophagus irregularis DAOM 181602=DAOM 197198]|eukprot:XP_025178352.1 kinase-like domain-containing protein [Rhizophagus irregularis DAOM 181602=DAOM 197198]
MDEIKLSNDVIEQIKDFDHRYRNLTKEQKSLIDKLITDKELIERYKRYGLCGKCNQPKSGIYYCQLCKSQYFKQNFKNWTSGNHDVDEFIQKAQLKAEDTDNIIEWIEYDKFEDVEYLAKGGFGTTFKAVWKDGPILYWSYNNNQWMRKKKMKVALKCLHNSQDITADFLKEVESNILVHYTAHIVRYFGITKDPKTNNFMMVMDLKNGSLRQHLNNNFISLNWNKKLRSLHLIAIGLKDIHKKGLIHQDFHCGNILSNFDDEAYITDLGLCQPANIKSSQNSNKKIYGVLPYVAPEVLRGKEYTQKSDIYGFGIIAYEICTGFPPYYYIAHDDFLAMKICNGLRPKSNYKIPQLIFDIINQCWDADPLKRPNVEELRELLWNYYYDNKHDNDSEITKQIDEANKINFKLSSLTVQTTSSSTSNLLYTTHTQAIYTSRLLNFKNLPEPKNANNNVGIEYSESIKVDFTNLYINSDDCA